MTCMCICDNSPSIVSNGQCVQAARRCGFLKLSRCRDARIGGNIILLMAIMYRQEVASESGVGNRVVPH